MASADAGGTLLASEFHRRSPEGWRYTPDQAKALFEKLVKQLRSSFGPATIQDSLTDASLYKKVHTVIGNDWRSPLCQRR